MHDLRTCSVMILLGFSALGCF